ncbi:glycosyltransferase [Methanobrevibacter curvatus]|uniref:UDP-Glc:alpha-D-GlcNAc-diphosphoundecaprenol beta-1,3-glucosyltransferase WfgD n=1 Tax=Methanobrevibacter curvatus TaxID=49547 RepID=A0A166ALE5_9EURY|nr:glycosyltransferase [Methanobrevibacter curvatus]KZX12189.1 UDP-Glc:alpha-D-GlcNAc-diphosphoundecaprenol beta-1,3-glucosyltransferase WfgD [Methanobrevibacter curvatus]
MAIVQTKHVTLLGNKSAKQNPTQYLKKHHPAIIDYMKKLSKISIIMLTFNRKNIIKKAINSIVNQSFSNYELIICDDGSTDGTEDMVKREFRGYFKQNKFVYLKQNHLGVSKARNNALRHARGELIAYLDADHYWKHDYLEKMAQLVKDENDSAYCLIEIHDLVKNKYHIGQQYNKNDLLKSNFIDLNTFVHKTQIYRDLGGFNESLTSAVDWDIILRYTKNIIPYFLNEVLVYSDEADLVVSKIPQEYKYKFTSSSIFCNVAPSVYLNSFFKGGFHRKFWNLESYTRLSILNDQVINSVLTEEDMRIISIMDQEKRMLHEKYKNRPQNELVSIIMPTYNRSKVIPDAIISVISQTYENWELIIVDDGGTDNTGEIVHKFNDKRIIYHKLSSNKGSAIARNTALAMSKGSIISYLDDDNIWDIDMLLISVNELRDSNRKIIYSAQIVWDGFNEISRIGNNLKYVRFSQFNRSLLENHNYIDMMSLVHDRSLFESLGGFDESLKSVVDWDLILRYSEKEIPKSIPCILGHYFAKRCDESISSWGHTLSKNQIAYQKLIERSCFKDTLFFNDNSYTIFGTSKIAQKERSNLLSRLDNRETEIIIPNYESKVQLKNCVESIVNHTSIPYNILICDNNSSEDTRIFLNKLCQKYDNIRWIKVDENQGFSHAVNEGLKAAFKKNNDILILNNDTIVTPNWLDELKLVLYENKDVGVVFPRQVLLNGSKTIKAHSPRAASIFEVDVTLSHHHSNIINRFGWDKFELNYSPFFCTLIRYEDAVSTGFLDVKNGAHYRSDWIYSDLLRIKTGKKIVYTPYSKVYHLHRISTDHFLSKNKKNL